MFSETHTTLMYNIFLFIYRKLVRDEKFVPNRPAIEPTQYLVKLQPNIFSVGKEVRPWC